MDRTKPLGEPKKLTLRKSVNGHASRGSKEYYRDLAEIAARKTQKYLLTLPLKKLLGG